MGRDIREWQMKKGYFNISVHPAHEHTHDKKLYRQITKIIMPQPTALSVQ